MMAGFAIRTDVGRALLAGELDLACADELRVALALQIGPDDVVDLDLGEVTFMDSSAAEVLLDLVDAGVTPVLRRPRPIVDRVLHLVGLGPYVTV